MCMISPSATTNTGSPRQDFGEITTLSKSTPIRSSAAHTVVMAAIAVAWVAPLEATAQNRAPRTSVSRAADVPPFAWMRPGLTA